MGEIENRFWTEADAIVTDNSGRGMLRDALKFPGDIFRYGQSESTIEMWRKGTWYYVKSGNDRDYRWPKLPHLSRLVAAAGAREVALIGLCL